MLLFYISSKDNLTIFDEICLEKGIILRKQSGQINLKKLIIEDMTNFSHISYFSVDLSAVKNTEEEIIEAFLAFQSMYNARIILLALTYGKTEKLLARLVDAGIYNIITSTNDLKSEISECMSELGRQYKSALIQSSSNVATEAMAIKVGICGTQSKIGTTTQGILLSNLLNSRELKACYVEANANSHIKTLAGYYEVETNDRLKCIKYGGMDMFYDSGLLATILSMNYKLYVIDYGVLDVNNLETFLKSDVKIVCAGAKTWEMVNIINAIRLLPKPNEVNFIFSFVSKTEQPDISRLMEEYTQRVYFSELVDSMFSQSINASVYEEIFRGYLPEEKPKSQASQLKKIFLNLMKGG